MVVRLKLALLLLSIAICLDVAFDVAGIYWVVNDVTRIFLHSLFHLLYVTFDVV